MWEGGGCCRTCAIECSRYVLGSTNLCTCFARQSDNLNGTLKDVMGLEEATVGVYNEDLYAEYCEDDEEPMEEEEFIKNYNYCRDKVQAYYTAKCSPEYQELLAANRDTNNNSYASRRAFYDSIDANTDDDIDAWYKSLRSRSPYQFNEQLMLDGNPHDLLVFLYFILCYPIVPAALFTDGSINLENGQYRHRMAAYSIKLHSRVMVLLYRLSSFYKADTTVPSICVGIKFSTTHHELLSNDDADQPPQRRRFKYKTSSKSFTLSSDHQPNRHHVSIFDEVEQEEVHESHLILKHVTDTIQNSHESTLVARHHQHSIAEADAAWGVFSDQDMRDFLQEVFDRVELDEDNNIENKWYRHIKQFLLDVFEQLNVEPSSSVTEEEKTRIRTSICNGEFSLYVLDRVLQDSRLFPQRGPSSGLLSRCWCCCSWTHL